MHAADWALSQALCSFLDGAGRKLGKPVHLTAGATVMWDEYRLEQQFASSDDLPDQVRAVWWAGSPPDVREAAVAWCVAVRLLQAEGFPRVQAKPQVAVGDRAAWEALSARLRATLFAPAADRRLQESGIDPLPLVEESLRRCGERMRQDGYAEQPDTDRGVAEALLWLGWYLRRAPARLMDDLERFAAARAPETLHRALMLHALINRMRPDLAAPGGVGVALLAVRDGLHLREGIEVVNPATGLAL